MAITSTALNGCHTLDDDRIPPFPVYLNFATQADWITYGVAAALDTKVFVKTDRLPQGYPYTAMSATGFGGVLLVCDYTGNPVAYDLACPVECKADVRIRVDHTLHDAFCPVCHSRYDIYSGHGFPTSGPAQENRFGLQIYHVSQGSNGSFRTVVR